MTRDWLTRIAVVGALLAPGSALAQGDHGETTETTTYDFKKDDVTGEIARPPGTGITGEDHEETESLIEVRANFVPEMVESTEDL